MIIETYGKNASSKQSKHINVRYFFIKDRIQQKQVKLAYCPTEYMWSDILTKPLQRTKIEEM